MVAVCVRLPETPLTRIENVPVDALLPADRVSVLVPVVLLGLNDALTPRGRAEADRRTLPLKRFCGETVMVDGTQKVSSGTTVAPRPYTLAATTATAGG